MLLPLILQTTIRLDDPNPSSNDKSLGADHWVSPKNLKDWNNQPGHYKRTVGTAVDKAFPNWARATSDPEVATMKRSGALASNYSEFSITGVDKIDFLFYTGVK